MRLLELHLLALGAYHAFVRLVADRGALFLVRPADDHAVVIVGKFLIADVGVFFFRKELRTEGDVEVRVYGGFDTARDFERIDERRARGGISLGRGLVEGGLLGDDFRGLLRSRLNRRETLAFQRCAFDGFAIFRIHFRNGGRVSYFVGTGGSDFRVLDHRAVSRILFVFGGLIIEIVLAR